MAKANTTTHADAVAALSSLPKDKQAIVWDYLMTCGAESPSLTEDETRGLLNEISCTAINIDELVLDYMHRDWHEVESGARWALLESVRTLALKIGAMSDHLHSPHEGDIKGDAYDWLSIPKVGSKAG